MTYRLPQIKKTFALQLVCPTGLMISPPASTISLCLRVCVFLFQCQAAGIINGTPPEYQLSWFARKRGKKNMYLLTHRLLSVSKKAAKSSSSFGTGFFLLLRSPLFPDVRLTLQKCCHFPISVTRTIISISASMTWKQTKTECLCVYVVSNPPVSNHWVGDSHKLHFRSL